MTLSFSDAGKRVVWFHGHNPGLYGMHFRVVQVLPHGSIDPVTDSVMVGDWAVTDDGDGNEYIMPQSCLSPLKPDARCICDACYGFPERKAVSHG